MYKKILVPFDGSSGSWKAMRKAILLAGEYGAELAAISVEERLPQYAATIGEVEDEMERQNRYFAEIQSKASELALEQGIDLKTESRIGHAADTIIRYAEERKIDLIVIGHSGHSGMWGILLGSTTARVVNQAKCDVLVVR